MRRRTFKIGGSGLPDSERGNARSNANFHVRTGKYLSVAIPYYSHECADRGKPVSTRGNPPCKTLGLNVTPCGVGLPGDLIVRTSSKLDV